MKALLLTPSALLLFTAPSAFAQMVVIGDGNASLCYQSAKMGNTGSVSAIRTCTKALEDDIISKRDEAATYVNRGVLQMRADKDADAEADFLSALAIKDNLPEAHINYGVTLFKQGRLEAALSAYDTSLTLDALETNDELAAMALFNRALVQERLGNTTKAYYDFKAALDRQPEWELAQDALDRFTVTRRAAS